MLPRLNSREDSEWLTKACNLMRTLGVVAIEGVLDNEFLTKARAAMYRAQAAVLQEVGKAKLDRSDELGVIRLPLKYEPILAHFLELPETLALIDNLLSPYAVLQFQTGLVLPPKSKEAVTKGVFQTRFHMDFPRVLNGYLMSINLMFAIDEYRVDNGATQFLLGSHQQMTPPDVEALRSTAIQGVCPAGSMILFDSTLFHAAGTNTSNSDRVAVNHGFVPPWVKQHIDVVRMLGDEFVVAMPRRTQTLLGWDARMPADLDEYYRPPAERLYKGGQG
jgi:ectoine hydroxylase-related dioxygenase (phytanoyl-CoA dioxygenase family)